MKTLIDLLKELGANYFNYEIINLDVFDILYIISTLEGFPQQENDGQLEELDLENYGFMEISDNKIVFYAGGDWQRPMEIVVELIDKTVLITSAKEIEEITPYIEKELDYRVVEQLLGIENDD